MGRAKHKRSNAVRRKRVRQLVKFWYDALETEGAITFGRDGERRTVAIEPELPKRGPRGTAVFPGSDPKYWSSSDALTADGSETKEPPAGGGAGSAWPATKSSGVVESEGRRYIPLHDGPKDATYYARLAYARNAMRHVAQHCLEARQVLEMDAAGWSWDQICEQMKLSEMLARGYLEAGIAHIMSYQSFVKPDWPE